MVSRLSIKFPSKLNLTVSDDSLSCRIYRPYVVEKSVFSANPLSNRGRPLHPLQAREGTRSRTPV
jgi:hypothetical protein